MDMSGTKNARATIQKNIVRIILFLLLVINNTLDEEIILSLEFNR